MAWYDLDIKEDDSKNESKKEHTARVKYDKILCEKAKSLNSIIGGGISENYQYRIITETGFNAITVIQYLYELYDLQEIYIAVYRMNQRSVNKLIEIITNENIKCRIILSSFFRENKRYEKWCEELISFSNKKSNVQISFAWSHAKVFLAKTSCGKNIVFEGSGNLSDNARIEQYLIENNKTTYDFHSNWMDEILNS